MEAHTSVMAAEKTSVWHRFNAKNLRDYTVIFAVAALFVVLSISSAAFLTERNLLNVAEQWAPVGFMALGGTVVIIAGGFDLSVGSIYVLSGVVAAKVANGTSAEIGLIAGVLAGAALGLFNGFLVTIARMNHFVATVGTLIMFSGIAQVMTDGSIVAVTAGGFNWLGDTKWLGVRLSIWLLLVAIVLFSFLLSRTSFGRQARAVGGNIEAARLAGLRTDAVVAGAYVLSGLTAGIAAALVASRSVSASANASTGIEFQVWTAIMVGGNSLIGGEGAVWRTVVGVALLALISNGFNLLGVSPTYQQVVTGAILLLSVGIDSYTRSRRA
jgi:ribose transport system permease protein